MSPLPGPAAVRRSRRFAATLGAAACCAAAVGCRGGGGFLAAKPAADPFAAAVAAAGTDGAGDADAGVVSLSDPGVGGSVRTASAEVPASSSSRPGVTRVDPFASPSTAPAPAAGGWLPGDGRDEPPAVTPAAFASSDSPSAAVPAVATAPSGPLDWEAELAAFAGPAAAKSAAAAVPPAATPAPPAAPVDDPFAAVTPAAAPAAATAPPAADPQGEWPPAPRWDAEPAAAPAKAPEPRPAALGAGPADQKSRGGDGWHSRRPTDVDPFGP